jgi:hypothetical protein
MKSPPPVLRVWAIFRRWNNAPGRMGDTSH